MMEKAAEQQAAADVSGFQVVFKIPGRVSLGASEGAKSLRISSASIAPDLTVRAVPVLDPTAFLEASFKQTEDAPLLPGRVAIYRDGVFVGRGQMAAAAKDETVRLGFGADDKIKIERTVVKRNEGSAGLIVTTSKTDERSFKTTVRNGHDFPIRIAIEDQLPVSENEDIVVEMLPSTTAPTATNLRDKRGVLEWAFEAKAGEVQGHQLRLADTLAQGQGRRDGAGGVRRNRAARTSHAQTALPLLFPPRTRPSIFSVMHRHRGRSASSPQRQSVHTIGAAAYGSPG